MASNYAISRQQTSFFMPSKLFNKPCEFLLYQTNRLHWLQNDYAFHDIITSFKNTFLHSIPIWDSEIFQSKDIARRSFTYTMDS